MPVDRLRGSLICLLVVAVIAASCGDDDGASGTTLPADGSTTTAFGGDSLPPADPASIDITTDAGTSVSAVIGPDGGTIGTVGPGGVEFTLTIPEGALLADVEITMTPISGATGDALGDAFAAGVVLEPAGLHFTELATVEIAGAAIGGDEVGFSAESGGQNFHLAPSDGAPGSVVVPTAHFSVTAIAYSQVADLADGYTPSGLAQIAWHAIARADLGILPPSAAVTALELWGDALVTAMQEAGGTAALETSTAELMTWFLYAGRLIEQFGWTASTPEVAAIVAAGQALIDTWFAEVDGEVTRLGGLCAAGDVEAGFLIMRWAFLGIALQNLLALERGPAIDRWKDAVTECFSFQVSWDAAAVVAGAGMQTRMTAKAQGSWPGAEAPGFVDSWLEGKFGLDPDDITMIPIDVAIVEVDFFGLSCTSEGGVIDLGFNLDIEVPNLGLGNPFDLGESEISGMIAGVRITERATISCQGEPNPGDTGKFFYDYFDDVNQSRLNADGVAVFELDVTRGAGTLSAETTAVDTRQGDSTVTITQTITAQPGG